MEKIMDMVKDVAVLYKLEIELENRCEDFLSTKTTKIAVWEFLALSIWMIFHDDSASSELERLVRFCRDYGTDEAACWRCRPVTPAGPVALYVDSLYLHGLSWITNEVPSLSHSTNRVSQYTRNTTVNQNEFIQPQLYVRP
jgi:hypothetical protein